MNVIVMCKSNSIEIWRHNNLKKGTIEMVYELNLYCNILRLFVIKSSSLKRSDILFILSEDLSFRFFRLSLNGGVQILSEGRLRNTDSERITDAAIVFLSQISTSAQDSSGIIGIYAFYKNINVI